MPPIIKKKRKRSRIVNSLKSVEWILYYSQKKLSIIKKFLDELFEDRNVNWKYDIGKDINPNSLPNINWTAYDKHLSNGELTTFRAVHSISYYLPSHPFYELYRFLILHHKF